MTVTRLSPNADQIILLFFEKFGCSYLPERPTFKMIQQHRRWTQALKELIQVRKDQIEKGNSESYGRDLLGLMMLAADEDASDLHRGGNANFDMQSLIGECKTFYFAGHETTSTLLTWTLMLLGTHTEWQDQARAEVLEVCSDRPVDADAIGKLKVVRLLHRAHRLSSFFSSTNKIKETAPQASSWKISSVLGAIS